MGKAKEKKLFSGHNSQICLSNLVRTDVYGVIIRLDIKLMVSVHDRKMHNNAEPF